MRYEKGLILLIPLQHENYNPLMMLQFLNWKGFKKVVKMNSGVFIFCFLISKRDLVMDNIQNEGSTSIKII